MSSSDLETQKAIFDAVKAAVAPVVVEDEPRQDAGNSTFPYVHIGESTSVPWDTKTEDGEEHPFTLHVWSRYAGKKEARLLMGLIRDAVHEITLPITGFTCVSSRVISKEIITDPDLRTRHGFMRVRVRVSH